MGILHFAFLIQGGHGALLAQGGDGKVRGSCSKGLIESCLHWCTLSVAVIHWRLEQWQEELLFLTL